MEKAVPQSTHSQHLLLFDRLALKFYRDLTTENLQYLSSRQALMDTAAFIKAMNEKLPSDVKWIMFGGSYAGSLAAWMRIKYPSLVHGAISSSSPLLAEVDFHREFLLFLQKCYSIDVSVSFGL